MPEFEHILNDGRFLGAIPRQRIESTCLNERFQRAAVPNTGTCTSVNCHFNYPNDTRSWEN